MDKSHFVKQTLENARENYTWRFFSNADHQWRWERLAVDGLIVEQSESSYPQYENCVANACEKGYVFLPSSSTKTQNTPPRKKRSYFAIPTPPKKTVPKL